MYIYPKIFMEECMNTFKRILSAVLSTAITLGAASMISVSAANIQFTDVSDHWAWTNGQIPYLVEKGVLNGYEQANGTFMFKPDGIVKRSEFIKMLDETFGLTQTTSISFSDVPSSEWYYTYFQRAAAQGYLLDYGTKANPSGEITREEAAALLVRYLDLPANEKADASTFADSSSISAGYLEYVLRAVHAGIINGYSENGKTLFKPQKTLTRAEALTILYRASGCIYNESAGYRSGKASTTNNTVTDSGITISDVVFNGRNIVTEGASGGKITFTGCTFNGTLYVRGSASIIFDDCDVKEVILMGGGNITVVSGTEIDEMTAGISTTINTYVGTTIGNLTIQNGADFSKVSGDGAVLNAVIRARDFTSSVIPTEFEIGNNLTAYFAEKEFQGTSDAQNAFAIEPFSSADENTRYLNLVSNEDGRIYYYYTNVSSVPSVSAFNSYYENAEQYGSFEVKGGDFIVQETLPNDEVTNLKYIAVQLQYGTRKYTPVVIENTGSLGYGFKTNPYVYDETTIKFQTETSGTLYWFYADDGKNLNSLEFLSVFEGKESALKGITDVTSIKSFTCTLKEKYLENYSYVAFMLVSGNKRYTPVIVSVGNDGFISDPAVRTPGEINFKSSVTGDLFYYYSENSDLPTAENFKSNYNNADEKDKMSIQRNMDTILKYDLDQLDDYSFLIMAIRNDDGEYMQPVALNIDYSTGFRNDPAVKSSSEISFRTKYEGSVQYYYTKSDKAPNTEDFLDAYGKQTSKYKGTMDVSTYYEVIEYSSSYASTYPFMAIMFTSEDDEQFSPVIIALDATLNTGFTVAPYAKDGTVYLHAEEDGEVWYFYSRFSDSVAPDEFEDEYDDTSSSRKDSISVSGGEIETFEIDEDILEDYPYLVIAFTEDDTDPDFSFPFVLDVAHSETSNAGSGLKVGAPDSDNEVRVELLYDGDLYWYTLDDTEDLPVNRDDFESKWNSISDSDRKRNMDKGDYEYLDFGNDDYIVCALKVNDEFLDYVIINLEMGVTNSGSSANDILGSYDKSSYGFTYLGWNKDNILAKATNKGTLELFSFSLGLKQIIESQSVSAGDNVEFDTPKTLTNTFIGDILGLLGDSSAAFYLQFTDTEGNTYKPYHITNIN